MSRQGHPTIAHRFNGGTSDVSDGPSPGKGDRNRRPRQSRIVAINPAAKASVVPTGTRSVVQVLVPTVETVGYCRVSLRDKNQETTLREITLEALAPRHFEIRASDVAFPRESTTQGAEVSIVGRLAWTTSV